MYCWPGRAVLRSVWPGGLAIHHGPFKNSAAVLYGEYSTGGAFESPTQSTIKAYIIFPLEERRYNFPNFRPRLSALLTSSVEQIFTQIMVHIFVLNQLSMFCLLPLWLTQFTPQHNIVLFIPKLKQILLTQFKTFQIHS